MTDLFRGYDLTTVADKVTEAQYRRHREEALGRGFEAEQIPDWEALGAIEKHNLKSNLLPVITDVLDALESDQVKPTEAKQMVEYAYNASTRDDPRWYENQPHQHDVHTATVWALHIHVTDDEATKAAILERMAVLPETTGEYTFGDSWRQWCEPAENGGDVRLCVYFHATPEKAASIGHHLATHATFAAREPQFRDVMYDFGVSTSGDYAEQVDV